MLKFMLSFHITVPYISEEEEVFIYIYFLTFFLVEIAQNDFFLHLFLPSIVFWGFFLFQFVLCWFTPLVLQYHEKLGHRAKHY